MSKPESFLDREKPVFCGHPLPEGPLTVPFMELTLPERHRLETLRGAPFLATKLEAVVCSQECLDNHVIDWARQEELYA